METSIIVCLITSITSVIVAVISAIGNFRASKKSKETESYNNFRIDSLSETQKGLQNRVIEVERNIPLIFEKISVANHRIQHLETWINAHTK